MSSFSSPKFSSEDPKEMTKNKKVSVTNISNISFSSAFCWKETFYTGSFSSCMAWHWSVCFYFVRLGNNSIEIRFSEWYMSWIINLHIPLLRLQYTYTRVYNVTASFWPHLKTLLFLPWGETVITSSISSHISLSFK